MLSPSSTVDKASLVFRKKVLHDKAEKLYFECTLTNEGRDLKIVINFRISDIDLIK